MAKQIQSTHPWKIIKTAYDPKDKAHLASLFSLANGYLGIRGSHEDDPFSEDGTADGIYGTYMNGFYETGSILYGESAYGFADTSETIQNIANALPIELIVDNERFSIDQVHKEGRLLEYERSLAMSYGQLERRLVWRTLSGKRIRIDSRRMLSLTKTHLACLVYRITLLDADEADIKLVSTLDGWTKNRVGTDDPRVAQVDADKGLRVLDAVLSHEDQQLALLQETHESKMQVACSVAHHYSGLSPVKENGHSRSKIPQRISLSYEETAKKLKTIEIHKYIAYADSIDLATKLAREARQSGYHQLRLEQESFLTKAWQHAHIRIQGDLQLQQGLNFSLFHLIQNGIRPGDAKLDTGLSEHEPLRSIAAKGLSGEGYEGHYFWDTEMYLFPFFLYTEPDVAKRLLEYRYAILPQARDRAKIMHHKRGALYPWRGISGRECSAYYAAGTAQAHINSDIALAVIQYLDATKDEAFLWDMGLEMLVEIAVFYLDLGFMDPKRGFVINAVTGPDEYSAVVNNNYYTNLSAKRLFEALLKILDMLSTDDVDRIEGFFKNLDYDMEAIKEQLDLAAKNMVLPKSEALGLPLQDDAVLNREPWDFLGTPKDKYPLLLHTHPLVIYRHRVSKQADLILAQSLWPDAFTKEELMKAFRFYELHATHDSSLSTSIYSVAANRLQLKDKAYRYFMETTRLDLDDTHGNTADGLHLANMGGNWLALVRGYAGMQVIDGQLHFAPKIPKAWTSIRFNLLFQGSRIEIKVSEDKTQYKLLEGKPLNITHDGLMFELTDSQSMPRTSKVESKLKAVIFDVDGVLLSTDEEHYLAWKRLCDEEDLYFDRNMNQRLRGVSRMASLEIILEHSHKHFCDEVKLEMATRKNRYYQEAIQEVDETAVLTGVVRLLDELKDSGLPMASASSSQNAATLLKATGLDHYFDVQIDGNDITRSKPDPEVFLKAAKGLGIKPENCLVFEDASAGIQAAIAGGMSAFALGKIASNFLELGAKATAWTLDNVHLDDLFDVMRE